jgi:hypothetical protein
MGGGMSAARGKLANQQARGAKWVHYPLADLWKLALNPKGQLQWMELEAAGTPPFPRSRHTMEPVPTRGLALLFGGRAVHAHTCLGDMYCLDVPEVLWYRLDLT